MSFYDDPVFGWVVLIIIFGASAVATLYGIDLMENNASPKNQANNSESDPSVDPK
jgi:hypothetical protein